MKKFSVFIFVLFSLFTIHYSLFTRVALAHCPLCVAGAGAALTLSRWIGLDDSITGLWLAAFLGAVSFWSYSALVKKIKKPNWAFLKPTLYLAIFASSLWSFYKFNLVIRMEKMYGLDKLTFGIIVGGTVFYLIDIMNDLIIKVHGKSLFPYQRMIFSLGTIAGLSFIDYILIGYYI